MRCNWFVPLVLGYFVVSATITSAIAGDWPQILGPNRNGVAVDERIAASWPDDRPAVLWQRSTGSGFSGVSVSEGVAVLFHRVDDEEIVEGMNAVTGERLWKSSFPAGYVPSYTSDDGPRAPAVIDRGRVYVYGALGDLRCLDLKDGKTLWERNTYEEYNSKKYFRGEPPEGYFGLASSPIVEGDKVIANVGGDAKEAGIVAFSVDTGRTEWKATSERASYSSPVATTAGGKRHVVFVTRLNVISLDPATGAVRFRFPFGRIGPTVNAANPLVFDGYVFATASYGIGSVLAKIGDDGAEIVWQDAEILASQYTTCVEHDGHLFGINGRQDGPLADLTCFDPKTRKVAWTARSFGYATLLRAGDKLLITKTDGTLVLAAANVDKYEELARARICETTIRALPGLSGGLLYVRDTRVLKCLDLRPGT